MPPAPLPDHDALMRAALDLAERAMSLGEVPIAALLARPTDGGFQIVGWGWNEHVAKRDATMHAELAAFRDAAGRYPPDARDLVLVSTLEPCVMCFGAALLSGVATVVYALPAPADGGAARVRKPDSPDAGWPEQQGGVRVAESRALFERWLKLPDRPERQRAFVEQLLSST